MTVRHCGRGEGVKTWLYGICAVVVLPLFFRMGDTAACDPLVLLMLPDPPPVTVINDLAPNYWIRRAVQILL